MKQKLYLKLKIIKKNKYTYEKQKTQTGILLIDE